MGATTYDEFEIDGVRFRLSPLPVAVAEALAPALVAMLTPAAAAIFAGKDVDLNVTQLGDALRGLTGSAEQLPKFRAAFAAQCVVTLAEKAGDQLVWTELKGNVYEETFRRKHLLYFKWLGRCIEAEFGAFLAETGQELRAAVKGSRWSSLIGFPGESGDSPPTPESKTD